MEIKEMLSYVDHTQLQPYATWEDMKKLCEEALEYHTASVCIPPCCIKEVYDKYHDKHINICTVVGFPLGYSTLQAKMEEVKQALQDGANEIDMVINISDVKNDRFDKVKNEISELKKLTGDKILKVIIETCYLTKEEKIKLCEIVTQAKADYIKTSTGFGTAGATLEDIKLFKQHIGKEVKIKAAGGVRTLEDMQNFIKEGCSRIGSSSAIKLAKGNTTSQGY